MTNAEVARKDKVFLAACEIVTRDTRFKEFKPSRRQASKWRMKKGLAWKIDNHVEIP